MGKQFVAAICGLTLLASAGVVAQRSTIARGNSGLVAPTFAAKWRPAGQSGTKRIIGTVIDIRMVPVGNTRVQLRNIVNGTVQEAQETTENGEYEFVVDDSGSYVVEMSLANGQIVAVSNAGTVAQFETLRTVVQLPGRWDTSLRVVVAPNNVDFLGLGSQQSMTQSTLTAAIEANIAPTNSGEAVSATTTKPS